MSIDKTQTSTVQLPSIYKMHHLIMASHHDTRQVTDRPKYCLAFPDVSQGKFPVDPGMPQDLESAKQIHQPGFGLMKVIDPD